MRYRWPLLSSLLSAVVGGGPEQLCGELFGAFGGDGVVADSGQGVDRGTRYADSHLSIESDDVVDSAAFGKQDADRYS